MQLKKDGLFQQFFTVNSLGELQVWFFQKVFPICFENHLMIIFNYLFIPGQGWRRVLQSDDTSISVSTAVSTSVREKSDFGSNPAHSVFVVTHDGSRRSGFIRDFLQQKLGSIQAAGGPGRRFPAQGIETLKQNFEIL